MLLLEEDEMQEPIDPFAELLFPVLPDEFFRSYWKQRSLYIPGSTPKCEHLRVTVESFFEAISPVSGRATANVSAQYFDANNMHQQFRVPSGAIEIASELVDSGMTLCVSDYHQFSPPVNKLAQALARRFGWPLAPDISCYLSSDARGFGLHFDNAPVLLLQCEGAKRWRYGRTPVVSDPSSPVLASDGRALATFARRHCAGRIDLPSESDLEEVTLSKNDVLFLPAGTWHRGYADGISIALTFTLSPRRSYQQLAEALARHIAHSLTDAREPPLESFPSEARDLRSWAERKLDSIRDAMALLDGPTLGALLPGPQPQDAAADGDQRTLEGGVQGTEFSPCDPESLAIYTLPGDAGRRIAHLVRRGRETELPSECLSIVEAIFTKTTFTIRELNVLLETSSCRGLIDASELISRLHSIGVITHFCDPT